MINKDDFQPQLFVKLCWDKTAFEVRTPKHLSLNMDEVKRTLEQSKQHKILVYTPHVVILKSGSAETTLSKDGRMLIKKVSNEAEATKVAKQILNTILDAMAFRP
jgi:ArsR family metal-binding transcriptional regulator